MGFFDKIGLLAGSAIVGKFGIDQTTDGTTNKVQARNATHGDFQVNATIQLNDTDVSASNTVPVKLVRANASASYTRPADTNAYAIDDALSGSTSAPAALNFADLGGANAQAINIVGAMATSSVKQSTLPDLELWLFKNSPTPVNDNSAFAISDAENNDCVGVIPFPVASWKYSSNNARCDVYTINIPVILDSDDVDLYGLVKVKNAYTPASEEVITLTLKVERA